MAGIVPSISVAITWYVTVSPTARSVTPAVCWLSPVAGSDVPAMALLNCGDDARKLSLSLST